MVLLASKIFVISTFIHGSFRNIAALAEGIFVIEILVTICVKTLRDFSKHLKPNCHFKRKRYLDTFFGRF